VDPDVTLAELREHVKIMNDDSMSFSTRATHGEWLQERFEQLDAYLSRGGLPPSAWNTPPLSLPETLDELHALSNPTPYPAPDATRRRAATAGLEAIERELKAHPTWKTPSSSSSPETPNEG
jgi:hypothetical protein